MSVYYTFKKFCPEIISIILTKKLSDSMNDVLESKINKEVVLSSAQNSVTSYYDKLKQNSEKIGSILSDSFQISKSKLTELYPHTCGKMLVIRKSKKTKKRFIACSGYPDCKFTLPLPQKGTISVEKKKCNKCKNTILSTVNRKKKWTFCPNQIVRIMMKIPNSVDEDLENISEDDLVFKKNNPVLRYISFFLILIVIIYYMF